MDKIQHKNIWYYGIIIAAIVKTYVLLLLHQTVGNVMSEFD